MAKTSNLREFQEAILLKLKDVATQGDIESTSRLGVKVGSKNLLVSLIQVREVLPVPPVQLVPHTSPWFLGVTNVRGNLYSLTDLGQFLGLSATAKTNNTRILLLNPDTTSGVTTQVALLIGGLLGLRNLDAMEIKQDAHKGEIFFCNQVYQDAEGVEWFEVDFEMLVKQQDFIQPTLN